MPSIDDVYAGDYVTAEQLPDGRRVSAVIVLAAVEEVGQEQTKRVVLTLTAPNGQPWPRRVVLNKTNSRLIADVAGKDYTTWRGRPIEVWKEPVSFQGRIVKGVRVSAVSSGTPPPIPGMFDTAAAIPLPGPAVLPNSGNGSAASTAMAGGMNMACRMTPLPGAMPGSPADDLDDEIPF
jgi:hypothetical protein